MRFRLESKRKQRTVVYDKLLEIAYHKNIIKSRIVYKDINKLCLKNKCQLGGNKLANVI